MKLIILIFICASLLSCSKNNSKVFKSGEEDQSTESEFSNSDNEEAISDELEALFLNAPQSADKGQVEYSSKYLKELYKKYTNINLEAISNLKNISPQNAREKILSPLQSFLVDSHWFFIPEIRGEQKFSSLVQEINRAQMISMSEVPLKEDAKKLAEKYMNFMFNECLPSKNNFSNKNCYTFEIYKNLDSKTANFLNLYVQLKSKILSEKVNEISNCGDDTDCIEQAYNKCFSEQECKGSLVDHYFLLAKSLEIRGSKLPEKYRNNSLQYISLFLNYLKTMNVDSGSTQRQISNFLRVMGPEKIKEDPSLRALIESKDTFKCSTRKASSGIFQGLDCFEYLLAAAPLMVEKCSDGMSRKNCKLSENLLSAVKEKKSSNLDKSQLSSSDHFSLKFDDYKNYFIEANEMDVLQSFGLNKSIDTNNLWFYYIDSVYQRDLLPSEVASLEAEIKKKTPTLSKRDFEDFKEILMHYMKIELLRMNSQSNEFMFDFYSKVAKSGINDQDLINLTLDQAKNLESNWNEVKIERFGALQQMAGIIFDQFEDEVKELSDSFLSIDNTINYLNVYPNMIMLTTYMALREFEFELRWWIFTFTIDYKRIISQMFSTGLGNPWFGFGDGASLRNYQILYSMMFAHQSGIFEKFSPMITNLEYVEDKALTKKQVQDSKIEFYKTLIFSYIQNDVIAQDNYTNNIRETFDSETYEQLEETCEAFNTNLEDEDGYLLDLDKANGVLSLPIETLEKKLNLSGLDNSMFTPGYPPASRLKDKSHALVDVYSQTSRDGLSRFLFNFDKEDRQKLDFIKNLADVYKAYLVSEIEKGDSKKEDFEKELEEIERIYNFINEKKWKFDELVARSFDFEKRYGGCMYAISKVYRQRAAKLIDLEKERLESIYVLSGFLEKLLSEGIDINEVSIKSLEPENLIEADVKILNALMTNLKLNSNKYSVIYPEEISILDAANELIRTPKGKLKNILYPIENGVLPDDADSSFCLTNNNQTCGHDNISEVNGQIKFKYSKYDFLFRTAEKIHLINPDVHIHPPVEFKDMASNANSQVEVFYSKDKEKFLERTLGVFHSDSTQPVFASWWQLIRGGAAAKYRTSKYNDRQRFLVLLYSLSGYKAKSVECYDALRKSVQPIKDMLDVPACSEDSMYTLNEKYLIKDTLASFDLIAISKKEKELLSLMDFENLYSYSFTQSIFKDSEDLSKEAFLFNNLLLNYEQMIINTNQDKAKKTESGGTFLSFKKQLTNFEVQTRNLGDLLFGYSYDLICTYKEKFRSWGAKTYGNYFKLQNSINNFSDDYYRNLELNYSSIGTYTVQEDQNGKLMLYDQQDYVTTFRDKFFAFYNKTLRGYFGTVSIEDGYKPNYDVLDSDNKSVYNCEKESLQEADVLSSEYQNFLISEGMIDAKENNK